jgi:hypothetical protein
MSHNDPTLDIPSALLKRPNKRKAIWMIALSGFVALLVFGFLVGSITGFLDAKAGRTTGETGFAWIFVGSTFVA